MSEDEKLQPGEFTGPRGPLSREPPPALFEGLLGWHRWGRGAAHYFRGGEQLCNYTHGIYAARGTAPRRPEPAELSGTGLPYGKVCSRCLKIFRGSP